MTLIINIFYTGAARYGCLQVRAGVMEEEAV